MIVRDYTDKMVVVSPRLTRVLPDLILLTVTFAYQAAGVWWLWQRTTKLAARRAIMFASGFSLALMVFGFLLRFERVGSHFPGTWTAWARGLAILWILLSLSWLAGWSALSLLALALTRLGASRNPARASFLARSTFPTRRSFLSGSRAFLFAAPAALFGYGTFIERTRFGLREQKVEIPNLPPDLEGIRLVQLTDIHLSPFLSRKDLDRAVAMANETRAHVALVTGDLITTGRDPLDDCLRALAVLRADAGIFGCLGNHEIYAGTEDYTEFEGARRGLRFLRQAAAPLRFGDATLNLAGVDYQQARKPYLEGAERMIVSGAVNVLLSHNPDVFPVAAGQGYSLTVSGHTHGGQVRIEILGQDLNVARFYTPYIDGVYRKGSASIFVSRGIGTIGLPARVGAPPEVALLHLCRA